MNLINGNLYIGSAYKGSTRLLNYFNSVTIRRNLRKYGYNNFCLVKGSWG